jgi:hypothetical protein
MVGQFSRMSTHTGPRLIDLPAVRKGVGLPSASFSKAPKAYVKLQVGDLSMRTTPSQPSRDPVWDEAFQM